MKIACVCAVLVLLAGCGSSEPPPPPKKTVFDPLTSQPGKVKAKTDAIVDERKGNLDQSIEADSN